MDKPKRSYWRRLDNAAKIFPAMSNHKDTRVFRFYCELEEEVQEEPLQKALDKTLEKYPIFLSVMRKGLFWHYLEKSDLPAIVREEYKEPCSNLYIRDKKDLLFEVTYYHKRISFEAYHVLTDGTGATAFLEELVKNYLLEMHGEEGLVDVPLGDSQVTTSDHESDGFMKYYSKHIKPERKIKKKAFQIHRRNKERDELQILEAFIPTAEIKKRCKELGVSVSVFITAAIIYAIHQERSRSQEHKPVVMLVPVNLRSFFPSDSMLNFFSFIEAGYQFGKGDDSFEAVLEKVRNDFKSQLTEEQMAKKMNEYITLEVSPILRFVPLELKNLAIHAGVQFSSKDTTAIFSNLGVFKMPEEYMPYISRFGAFTNTMKMEFSTCTFKDRICLSITARYDGTNIWRNFFKILKQQGVSSEIIEPDFPDLQKERSAKMNLYKIFTFLCILIATIALSSDYLMYGPMHLSFFVTGGIVSTWAVFSIGFFKRHNMLKNAMWQLALVAGGAVLWDWFTGWRGWSINYILPIAPIFTLVMMLTIALVKKLPAREYMIYFIMAAGFGLLLPMIMLLAGAVTFEGPTVICMGFCFMSLVGLILFKAKEFKEELAKKLHF